MAGVLDYKTRKDIDVRIDLSHWEGGVPQSALLTISGLDPKVHFDVVDGPWETQEDAIAAAQQAAEAWVDLKYSK